MNQLTLERKIVGVSIVSYKFNNKYKNECLTTYKLNE